MPSVRTGYHHNFFLKARKIHEMIVQPAILYGMETVPMTSSGSDRNEDVEMGMRPHAKLKRPCEK